MKKRPYYHVDVFATKPLSGNGLTVFTECNGLTDSAMLLLTQEMRQFESIFLQIVEDNQVKARIFTVEEELDFAGHPLLGAAAVLHGLKVNRSAESQWTFLLKKKSVPVTVKSLKFGFQAQMNQGTAEFGQTLNEADSIWLLTSIGLSQDDLYPNLRPTVVSTGLPYLIIPLRQNISKASLNVRRFQEKISGYGAKFIGILEVPTLHIRTGDSAGLVEDIATGSLAGPSAAFLVKNNLQKGNSKFNLNQGENLGRASLLSVNVTVIEGILGDIFVSGRVFRMANGWLDSSLENRLTQHPF